MKTLTLTRELFEKGLSEKEIEDRLFDKMKNSIENGTYKWPQNTSIRDEARDYVKVRIQELTN